MSDLLAARSQMAMSLAFHIVFACVGIAMPVLMALAEWRWQRTGDPVYLDLAKRWSKGTAILFAVGAVSGTVLSFELGLLWPEFMRTAGAIIGMPFSLEGFAFFLEAIFLGIYLYGWNRVSPRAHLFAAVVVAVSGAASAVFVVIANAWMNTPVGFRVGPDGLVDIDPIRAMLNPAAPTQTIHMLLAAYAATGFVVAGVHAWHLLRRSEEHFHRAALGLTLIMTVPAALLQPISGDFAARQVARNQPIKLAAFEGQWDTERGAPLRIGGWPDPVAERTPYAIEIPYALSLLAFHDPNAEVRGLTTVPPEDRPPVRVTHLAFQVMVGLGTWLMVVSLWVIVTGLRRRAPSRGLLRALVASAPLGFLAVEAGWTATEVGRQPWVIAGVLRTRDAVTPMPGLWVPFTVFTALYLGLAAVVVYLLLRITAIRPATRKAGEAAA